MFIDQKILRLEVAVEDTMRVAVEEAGRELVREFLPNPSAKVRIKPCLPPPHRHMEHAATQSRDTCDIWVRRVINGLRTRCDATL